MRTPFNLAVAATLIAGSLMSPASAQVLPPGGTFTDDDGNLHEGTIEAISAAGITTGCGLALYCPTSPVTRLQMAVFLVRALGESPSSATVSFPDVPPGPFSGHIERISELGIATGYPDGTFRPANPISRGEMAVMLMRALDLPGGSVGTFSDVPEGLFFTGAVEAIVAAGITTGCGGGRYCPFDQVLRDQMASFIARAFDLAPMIPPPRTTDIGVVEIAAGFEAPVFVTSPRATPGCLSSIRTAASGSSKVGFDWRPHSSICGDRSVSAANRDSSGWRSTPTTPAIGGSSSTTRTIPVIPASSSTRPRTPTPTLPTRLRLASS